MNELGLAVGEGPARRGVQVEGGEGLHQVLKLPAVGWKALVQTFGRKRERAKLQAVLHWRWRVYTYTCTCIHTRYTDIDTLTQRVYVGESQSSSQ